MISTRNDTISYISHTISVLALTDPLTDPTNLLQLVMRCGLYSMPCSHTTSTAGQCHPSRDVQDPLPASFSAPRLAHRPLPPHPHRRQRTAHLKTQTQTQTVVNHLTTTRRLTSPPSTSFRRDDKTVRALLSLLHSRVGYRHGWCA